MDRSRSTSSADISLHLFHPREVERLSMRQHIQARQLQWVVEFAVAAGVFPLAEAGLARCAGRGIRS